MFTAATLLVALGGADGNGCRPDPDPDPEPQQVSIYDTAVATPSLSTLVAAVDFASENDDLVNLLSDPGTLTAFAPSNGAFDALAVELTGSPSATGADLLTAANKPLLRSVLQYHVLTSEVPASAIPFGRKITTAEGSIFKIDAGAPPRITDGRNRATSITATDIEATNGVVHLVDRVLLPANLDLVQTAQDFATKPSPEFTLLVEAAVAAGLVPTLSGPGPFTVFAPTDAAFAKLLTELGVSKQQLFGNPALLARVLTYHVVPGIVLEAEIPVGQPIATAESGTFTIASDLTIKDERGRIGSIIATDVFAKNGVIHVIDKVILPGAQSLLEVAQATPDLSTLVAAAQFASENNDLVTLLANPGTLTLFAPTNAAFDALAVELTGVPGMTAGALLTAANKPLLRDVLAYHVLTSKVPASAIPLGRAITAAQNGIFKIEASPLRIIDGRNRSTNIIATDLEASNGVAHLVDRVILPANKNIVQTAQGVPSLSILVEAVVAADLANTLSGPGPFTVFAPTNAAFAALLAELHLTKHQLLSNKPLLKRVLTYHVLASRKLAAEIPLNTPLTTVETGSFRVNQVGGALQITDARSRTSGIAQADVFATNGVVHVIDKVILPGH